jgi:hypothetical protein
MRRLTMKQMRSVYYDYIQLARMTGSSVSCSPPPCQNGNRSTALARTSRGARENPGTICLDGFEFQVTRNLFNFLKALRLQLSREPLILWIDAICINQESLEERSRQVSMMTSIYSNAGRTFAWLGRAEGDTAWLFDTLSSPEIRALVQRKDEESDMTGRIHAKALMEGRSLSANLDTGEWELLQRGIKATLDLMANTYWRRSWITQEVTLSTNVTLLCGAQSLPWSDIPFGVTKFLWALLPNMSHQATYIKQMRESLNASAIYSLHMAKEEWMRTMHRSFDQVYQDFGHLQCSVPHDTIYSLLGLVDTADARARSFKVDYAMSPQDLLREVLQHLHMKHPMTLLTRLLANFKLEPADLARWGCQRAKIKFQIESVFSFELEDYHAIHPSEYDIVHQMPCLHFRTCNKSKLHFHDSSARYYTDASIGGNASDQLCLLGVGEWLVVRPQDGATPKIVGITLTRFGRSTKAWQAHLIRPYLGTVMRLLDSLIVTSDHQWFDPIDNMLDKRPVYVVEVDFQAFVNLAWLSGALFGRRNREEEVLEPYWHENAEECLRLLGYESQTMTWEPQVAAAL